MFEEKKVQGHVKPIASATRTRIMPSTYSTVIRDTLSSKDIVVIDKIRIYTENDPVQPHIRKGDVWGKVVSVNGIASIHPEEWIAIDYHTKDFQPYPICNKFYEIIAEDIPPVQQIDLKHDIWLKINANGQFEEINTVDETGSIQKWIKA